MRLRIGADARQRQVALVEPERERGLFEAQLGDPEALVLVAPRRRGQRQRDAQAGRHFADGRLDHAQHRAQHGVDHEAAHAAQIGAFGGLHRHAVAGVRAGPHHRVVARGAVACHRQQRLAQVATGDDGVAERAVRGNRRTAAQVQAQPGPPRGRHRALGQAHDGVAAQPLVVGHQRGPVEAGGRQHAVAVHVRVLQQHAQQPGVDRRHERAGLRQWGMGDDGAGHVLERCKRLGVFPCSGHLAACLSLYDDLLAAASVSAPDPAIHTGFRDELSTAPDPSVHWRDRKRLKRRA